MATDQATYREMFEKMLTPQLISEVWEKETGPQARDALMTVIHQRQRTADPDAWPSDAVAEREKAAGLYPDPEDPEFAARLFTKREFYEARAVAAGIMDGTVEPCSSGAAARVFELTPVQRIVSRFLHPDTPYNGMLLFHGVGVGKTCSAVTVAEQFLESAPNSKVIVLVPQALKENFRRTVFDPSKLVWNEEEKRWETNQCTGTSYLERLGLMETPDLRAVTYKTEEDRRSRYTITGYQAFANWIEKTLKRTVPAGLTDPAVRRRAENEVLRRLFSDHLIIVDEAHNLRDTDAGAEAAGEAEGGAATGEAAENAGGKALNPYLRRIILVAEGLRLMFMTATPMYNSAPEILLLLSYLRMNDAKKESAELPVSRFFAKDGSLIPGPPSLLLEKVARAYVSYMRGENPFTFPVRIRPASASDNPRAEWPTVSATKKPVVFTEEETAAMNAMPLVFTSPVEGSPPERLLRAATGRTAAPTTEGPPTDTMLDLRMQMANISYPNEMFGTGGWDNFFSTQLVAAPGHKLRSFTPKAGVGALDAVFVGEGLRTHAPKLATIVDSVRKARGICFAYSRYIKAGALPLAVALERAGFQRRLADGRLVSLLTGVPAAAPTCAICGSGQHADADHPFRPACYVLLTSDDDISPSFAGLVRQAATWEDDPEWGPLGGRVKVIIGSQVASEGLDLKCVREMHVLDPWYHLNRIDQIIGRAIRFCSHSALRAVESRQGMAPLTLNNCLIYLHALRVGGEAGFETADMYAYRIAVAKALMVGRVQRLLKRNAWDCNLELEAIRFTDLPTRRQVDAQGRDLTTHSVNDQDYTTYCDYQVCKHECAVSVPPDAALDNSTFGVADARRLILAKQDVIRQLFRKQMMVPESVVRDVFADLPWQIASEAMMELLNAKSFRVRRTDGVEGYLVMKAGWLVFQPLAISDTDIPLTMRYARAFQLRRRFMDVRTPMFARGAVAAPVPLAAAATAAGTVPVTNMDRWNEWVEFVRSQGKGTPPPSIAATERIWSWILSRFTVPETAGIALRWWFDKKTTYGEKRALLETAVTRSEYPELTAILRPDIFRSTNMVAYRVFNPETLAVEFFCRTATGSFGPCASNIAAIVDKQLGNRPVVIPAETGAQLGFLAAKKGRLTFKMLDTTKPKTHSSVGAECGITSMLGEHHPRVRVLQAAGREAGGELAALLLPDDDVPSVSGPGMNPAHMKDLTHQPLCLYLEFLARLLDARAVGGRRWFLDVVAAVQSGLKGKK